MQLTQNVLSLTPSTTRQLTLLPSTIHLNQLQPVFDRAPFDSLGRVANVSLEEDVCKQAGFLVSFGGLGCTRAGDISLPSFLASMNSVGKLVETILSSNNIVDTFRGCVVLELLLDGGGGRWSRTTGKMKWGEDDVVLLVAREEAANSKNEGYEGKESKSTCNGGRSLNWWSPARNWVTWRGAVHISPGAHAPTKQPRQPFLSQSAMRGSHVLACNGVRLTSQLKWRKASQPARFIPYIEWAMLSQFFAYCRDNRVDSYNITSDAIRIKHLCVFFFFFFFLNMFFSRKKFGLQKKHSKSVLFLFFFLNTHLKEITS